MRDECHHFGIRNFKSIRHPGQIKLAFDLCTNDRLAPKYVSSKGNDHEEKFDFFSNEILQLNDLPTKKTFNNWYQRFQYSKTWMNFMRNILYLIIRVLYLILKYTSCLIWYLFKILLCISFRLLTDLKLYRSDTFICHPVRCYHHRR